MIKQALLALYAAAEAERIPGKINIEMQNLGMRVHVKPDQPHQLLHHMTSYCIQICLFEYTSSKTYISLVV